MPRRRARPRKPLAADRRTAAAARKGWKSAGKPSRRSQTRSPARFERKGSKRRRHPSAEPQGAVAWAYRVHRSRCGRSCGLGLGKPSQAGCGLDLDRRFDLSLGCELGLGSRRGLELRLGLGSRHGCGRNLNCRLGRGLGRRLNRSLSRGLRRRRHRLDDGRVPHSGAKRSALGSGIAAGSTFIRNTPSVPERTDKRHRSPRPKPTTSGETAARRSVSPILPARMESTSRASIRHPSVHHFFTSAGRSAPHLARTRARGLDRELIEVGSVRGSIAHRDRLNPLAPRNDARAPQRRACGGKIAANAQVLPTPKARTGST